MNAVALLAVVRAMSPAYRPHTTPDRRTQRDLEVRRARREAERAGGQRKAA